MANSLNRQIQKDEVVVISADYVNDTVTDRRVRCTGGFGMMPFTAGRAIYVEFLQDCSKGRIEGYMIDVEETNALNR
jgi:hypothetical protein